MVHPLLRLALHTFKSVLLVEDDPYSLSVVEEDMKRLVDTWKSQATVVRVSLPSVFHSNLIR